MKDLDESNGKAEELHEHWTELNLFFFSRKRDYLLSFFIVWDSLGFRVMQCFEHVIIIS